MKIIGNPDIIKRKPKQNILLDSLISIFDKDDNCLIYHEYPFQKGEIRQESLTPDFFMISKTYGLFYFCILDEGNEDSFFEYVDNIYESIRSKLSKLPGLRKGRCLKYEINPVVITKHHYQRDDIAITDTDNLRSLFSDERNITDGDFLLIQSCIEGTCSLSVKKERDLSPKGKEKTKAQILDDIQNHIANFDIEQKQLSLVDYDGPQRIRGLAGSGKTIVLAHKVARFHAEHPEARILYTYYTKSLGDTVKSLIKKAYRNYSSDEPNWDMIDILHGWGSSYIPGVYSTACSISYTSCLTYKDSTGHGKAPFAYACEQLLRNREDIPSVYDLIAIDEGQDFPSEFYQLCYVLSRNKRICWAYDDFQNIFETEIQDEHQTFGYDDKGQPYVDFSSGNPLQDVVLKKCYRTPRIVLISAFALGLGIYNSRVLQGMENRKQWEGLGFRIEEGDCSVGSKMVVSRPLENTPSYSNEYFDKSSFILKICDSFQDECKYIADNINKLLTDDNLLCSDISVICVDLQNIKAYFAYITQYLESYRINTFNHLNAANDTTAFFKDGHITLSSVNKAKGNECGVVFVCGVDSLFRYPNNVVYRDRLFTAMTRTKGWLYLTGIGEEMKNLKKEVDEIFRNDLKLVFYQPDPENSKMIKNQSTQTIDAEFQIAEHVKRLKSLGNDKDSIRRFLDSLIEGDNDKK